MALDITFGVNRDDILEGGPGKDAVVLGGMGVDYTKY